MHVEHEDTNRTIVTCADMSATIIDQSTRGESFVWLPNEDGYDGSRIYREQLADTIAVLNQVAAVPTTGGTSGS